MKKIHCFEYLVTAVTIIFGFKLLKMLKNTQRRQKNPCFLQENWFLLSEGNSPGRYITIMAGMPGCVRTLVQ